MKADIRGIGEILPRDGEGICACVEEMKVTDRGATITDQRPLPQPTSMPTESDGRSCHGKI
jgi:hypothetical protein